MGIITYKNEHDIASLCLRVKEKMEENKSVFQTPPEALAILGTKLPLFQASLANAKSRDKEKVAIKNQFKAETLGLLQELAEYVELICNGNRALMLSSGFDVTEEQTSSKTTSIELVEVILGEPGVATTRVKRAAGVLSYIHQYTTEPPAPNTIWHGEGSSKGYHTFTGLTSDKRHWFRVVAVGRKGKMAYSPIVSRAIQ
jgi:hypothetical protein